jgi:hypothetical protein
MDLKERFDQLTEFCTGELEPFKERVHELLEWYVLELGPYKEFLFEIHKNEPDGIVSGLFFCVGCLKYDKKVKSRRYCFLYSLVYMLVDHTIDNSDAQQVIQDIMLSNEPIYKVIRQAYDEMNDIHPEGKDLLFGSFAANAHPVGSLYEQAMEKGNSIGRVFSDDPKDQLCWAVVQLFDDLIDHEEDVKRGKPTYIENYEESWENARKVASQCSSDKFFLMLLDMIGKHDMKGLLSQLQLEMINHLSTL